MNNNKDHEGEGLLPCPIPWCGDDNAEARRVGMAMKFAVRCTKCGACGPWAETESGAIAGWNTRAQPPASEGLVTDATRRVRQNLATMRDQIKKDDRRSSGNRAALSTAIEMIDAALQAQPAADVRHD